MRIGKQTMGRSIRTTADLFTGRKKELEAFRDLYQNCKSGESDVIFYYGIGGVGKYALLSKLERALKGNEEIEKNEYVMRYSFKEYRDRTQFLYTLARTISIMTRKPLPLFACAYIKLKKSIDLTEDQLIELFRVKDERDEELQTLSEASKFALSAVSDFVPILGSLTERAGEKGIDYVMDLIRKKQLRSDFKSESTGSLQMIDRADLKDLEGNLQRYLIEDCYKILKELPKPFVILLDDYEQLNDSFLHGDKKNQSQDSWIHGVDGLIRNLPNVFWVFSGREEPMWDEAVLPKDHIHELKAFSYEEAKVYFQQARNLQNLEMEDDLISGLYRLTGGNPIYMNLCFKLFEEGNAEELSDFGKETNEITNIYFEHMDNNQQIAMKFLCALPDLWTEDLAYYVIDHVPNRRHKTLYDTVITMNLELITDHSFVKAYGEKYEINDIMRTLIREKIEQKELDSLKKIVIDYYMEHLGEETTPEPCIDWLLDLDRYLGDDYSDLTKDQLRLIAKKGKLLFCPGLYREMAGICERGVKAYEKLTDQEDSNLAKAMSELSSAYSLTGEYQKALCFGQKAYELNCKLYGDQELETLEALEGLAKYYNEAGDFDKAIELGFKAREGLARNYPNSNQHLDVYGLIPRFYLSSEDYEQALEWSKAYYMICQENCEENDLRILDSVNVLAACYSHNKNHEKALEYGRIAYDKLNAYEMQILSEVLNVDDDLEKDKIPHAPLFLTAEANLATYYFNAEEKNKALEIGQKACKGWQMSFGKAHPNSISALEGLVIYCREAKDHPKALEWIRTAYEDLKEVCGEDADITREAKNVLNGIKRAHKSDL